MTPNDDRLHVAECKERSTASALDAAIKEDLAASAHVTTTRLAHHDAIAALVLAKGEEEREKASARVRSAREELLAARQRFAKAVEARERAQTESSKARASHWALRKAAERRARREAVSRV